MLNRADNDSRWDERIARAQQLAARYPAAADILIFYAGLAEYQKSLLGKKDNGASPFVPFFESLDLEPVLAAIPDFLSWLQRVAPARLAESAAEMRQLDRARWRSLAHSYLACNGRDGEDVDQTQVFVLEALLQPFAEQLAIRTASSSISARGGSLKPEPRCPICGGLPVVGVLREEGQGAKRTLVCALCLTEREYLRVVCPACGEQQFDALPVYTAEQFAHVRIEACESCRRYLKTIDLTKDGLAVPPVDDIASVSLDLWARDRGYVRLRPNLLRM